MSIHCSSSHKEKAGLLIVSLYVDDLIFTRSDERMFEDFKTSMKMEFDMTDLGKMKYFLGVEVVQNSEGIFLSQRKYAQEILEIFGMEKSNSVRNPMVPGFKLMKNGDGAQVDMTQYKQMVGSLMYLTVTRPDLAYMVSVVSRYMERPTELHVQAIKRILRYVMGTMEKGLWYKHGTKNEGKLVAFSDSDYAGDIDDRRSTSGYVFIMNGGAVAWSSKKQPMVTLSTTEAEFISAASCACQGVWMRRVLSMLGCNQGEPTIIYCDNNSAVKLSRTLLCMEGASTSTFDFIFCVISVRRVWLSWCIAVHRIKWQTL